MESFKPKIILVPTDLSEPAAHALRYASSLGERLGAHLLVVYADLFLPPLDITATAGGLLDIPLEVMTAEALEALRTHAEQNLDPRVPFDVRVIVADPLEAITTQVRESGANLIVMGTHGRTGIGRLLFGSVTEAVMRVASVPVIAVNPHTGDSSTVHKVLCPVTFTPACRDAVRVATALSGDGRPSAVLVRAVEDDDAHMGAQDVARVQAWAPEEITGRYEVKLVGTRGEDTTIVDLAARTHADLIAFSVPAGRSVTESLRGTIAERVVQRSSCPVLTVNAYAARTLAPAQRVPLGA